MAIGGGVVVFEVGVVFVVVGDVKYIAVVLALACVGVMLLRDWLGAGNCASSCRNTSLSRPGCRGGGGFCPLSFMMTVTPSP